MNLRLDDLQFEGLSVYQDPNGYNFTSDSVLLANFVKCKKTDKVVEFCAGTGVISILLSKKQPCKIIYGIEIQKKYCDMFNLSIKHNNLQDNIKVLNIKLEDAPNVLGVGYADVVFCNPPYLKTNESKQDFSETDIATKEIHTSLENVAKSASRLLKYRGKFFLIHRVDRLVDILTILRENKLEPKIMNIIYPDLNYEPVVVLIQAVKEGKSGLRMSKVTLAKDLKYLNKSAD